MKRREKDGVERVKVSYPKFKNGEATVRDVRVEPNFGKHLDLQIWTWKFLFWKIWKSIIFTEFSVFILGYDEEIFQTYECKQRRIEECKYWALWEDPCCNEHHAREAA